VVVGWHGGWWDDTVGGGMARWVVGQHGGVVGWHGGWWDSMVGWWGGTVGGGTARWCGGVARWVVGRSPGAHRCPVPPPGLRTGQLGAGPLDGGGLRPLWELPRLGFGAVGGRGEEAGAPQVPQPPHPHPGALPGRGRHGEPRPGARRRGGDGEVPPHAAVPASAGRGGDAGRHGVDGQEPLRPGSQPAGRGEAGVLPLRHGPARQRDAGGRPSPAGRLRGRAPRAAGDPRPRHLPLARHLLRLGPPHHDRDLPRGLPHAGHDQRHGHRAGGQVAPPGWQ